MAIHGGAHSSCAPKCETASKAPDSVCRRADAGEVMAGQSFTLNVTTTSWGTCVVEVDGGVINIAIESTYCEPSGLGGADIAAPRQVPAACQIPALPAGTYLVASDVPATFTIPASADGGLPTCP